MEPSKAPEIFLKPYNPALEEPQMLELWEKSGYANPDVCVEKGVTKPDAETFSIVLPPPNVTGILHMGSALMVVIEDIVVRAARMQGKRTLWIPGTDSAAIATQARVEKDIQKSEKKTRHDLGREELLRRIDVFVEENKSIIINQFKKMGASLDWSRCAYTMDEKRYAAVMEAFVRMHAAGLIYRGQRIVNWDPKGQTTISDDEIVYEERTAKLVTFTYSHEFPIPIATTRLETKVGDTAVAVHPDDGRYAGLVGKEYDAVFCGVPIHVKIVADPSVDPSFGTGALGVTPAHSHTDWEIADRHDLLRPQVIDEKARMTIEGALKGKKTMEAREIILEWLKKENLLIKEEEIPQNVATAERTGGIVEPLPKLQWFLDVNKPIAKRSGKTLKELMRDAVESGETEIFPKHFEKVYFNWIDNLRDWCISRQIWFGHRIPAWFRKDERGNIVDTIVGVEGPSSAKASEGTWEQDSDTLDTWFSSGLWTFSTLGWPEETDDLKTYHPTSLLETGYDILFFWVARMILMSQFHLGEIPFRKVLLHGIVRDGQGRKISKSLGNNIDPLDMSAKYGMDAVRMSLIAGMAPGTDSKISEEKIRGYKHFANKLWNITRFVLENYGSATSINSDDQKLVDEAKDVATEVSANIDNFRLDLAADQVYHFVWDRFAAEILEESKPIFRGGGEAAASRAHTLYAILNTSLKLLHPFMPFVTEAIWQQLPQPSSAQGSGGARKESDFLMVAKWPLLRSSSAKDFGRAQ
ncbi:valine--tRNA ligase [Candidatus Kaiserbacteria bacterium RIFCSPLOWO2_12_FULL_53_8]|uniref:Valine--tRNA ligase n=2 Tax=Candidatus Kaiseribacteriota TaxID=1752734 RepID=A0A1F6CWR1_9BACT|nr:MAG: valine--tRNA ligase [Candidatus Kaiserbacteria bacterium RIFCSPHIGHO2_01_FULL_53_29]OGG91651.1 MAG: valine--tRNA ligase [Candidatus Kaiserbacteria bacterium RIFCSPLOWO2_12_FULL_53_8]